MPDEPLTTRAELATILRCSDRTVRRVLMTIAATTPGFAPVRRGRATLFTRRDIEIIMEALRSPYAEIIARPITTRSVTYVSRKASQQSSQDAVREALRK